MRFLLHRSAATLLVFFGLLAGTIPDRAQASPAEGVEVPTAAAAPASAESEAAEEAAPPTDAAVQHRLDALTKKLGLSGEQQALIGKILSEEAKIIPGYFNNMNIVQDRKGARHVRLQARERISVVLTAPQREVYSEMRVGPHWLP